MTVIAKVQAQWNGFQGAPGYTNWYALSDGDAAAAANALAVRMRAFFDAIKANVPSGATIKVQRTYQVIDGTNGTITAENSLVADPTVVTGTAVASYAGPAGCAVTWETGSFNAAGHRVRGRTYLVPLAGAFDPDGSLSNVFLGTVQAAATAALGGTGALSVWSRNAPGASDGIVRTATAATIRDKASILRSRRD